MPLYCSIVTRLANAARDTLGCRTQVSEPATKHERGWTANVRLGSKGEQLTLSLSCPSYPRGTSRWPHPCPQPECPLLGVKRRDSARGKPVLCFAHATDQMAVSEGDFENSEAHGTVDALSISQGVYTIQGVHDARPQDQERMTAVRWEHGHREPAAGACRRFVAAALR